MLTGDEVLLGATPPKACHFLQLLRFLGVLFSCPRCSQQNSFEVGHWLPGAVSNCPAVDHTARAAVDYSQRSRRRRRRCRCRLLARIPARVTSRPPALVSKEICFYTIPTEKETAAGVKPELMKTFSSGHEEPVTKIVLLDVDRVGRP